MFSPFLSKEQNILLGVSFFLIVISFTFFLLKKHRPAILFLALGAIPLKYFFISIDHYLNYWDECFHALVAKNMMSNPFKPMLYKDALLPYDYTNWCGNHIWLHKQPLALWQGALSMKLFGVSEVAYRIPSMVLSVLFLPVIYRMGELLFSKTAGYIAAVVFTLSYYINSLTTGYCMSAENDLMFLVYTTASCWAYLEHRDSKNPRWILLIGLFSGLAVLTKWLVGILVYSAWVINILVEYKKAGGKIFKQFIPVVKSFLITLIVFLPWTIYTLIAFPGEAKHELSLNSKHFLEVVEGHSGTWMYHLEKMKDFYFPLNYMWVLPIIGLGIYLIKDKAMRLAMALFSLLPLLFYTIAKTKMPSFTIVVFVFVALLFSGVLDRLLLLVKSKVNKIFFVIIFSIIFLIVGFQVFHFKRVLIEQSSKNEGNGYRLERIHNMSEYISLRSKIAEPIDKAILFNVTFPYHIDMMFYTGVLSYPYYPNTEQITGLTNKGYQLYIINNNLPGYIKNDSRMKMLESGLKFNYSNW